MELISNLALAGGLSWASGLRLYLTVFSVGMLENLATFRCPIRWIFLATASY